MMLVIHHKSCREAVWSAGLATQGTSLHKERVHGHASCGRNADVVLSIQEPR